jgi:hypothetical protein
MGDVFVAPLSVTLRQEGGQGLVVAGGSLEMTYVFGKKSAQVRSVGPAEKYRPMESDRERIWHWVLRLTLPLVLVLSAMVLQWIWFDGTFSWWSIIGGLPLAFGTVVIGLWAFTSWL